MLYANFGCLERCCNNPAMQCHSTTRCQQHHMLQQSQLAVKLGNQSVRSVHRIVRPADRRHRLVSALPAADTAATVLPATYAALGLAGEVCAGQQKLSQFSPAARPCCNIGAATAAPWLVQYP